MHCERHFKPKGIHFYRIQNENKDANTQVFTGLPHHSSFVWMVKFLSEFSKV
ncbi:hypothetical protein ACJMK2_034069 [Sinanodonta woodiana]|uniref:Uncharacterized protein n=1 Tax=Sinanodonta woodiana TaxID=1069815 RepID=A0ABD3WQF2_SINWO